jgi:hypothetical protein
MAKEERIEKSLIGNAGVYHIASQLSLRRLIVLPTIRNAPGIDLVAVRPDGSWNANIQVKSSQDRVNFWPVGSKYADFKGANNYYAFVRYAIKERAFEVFFVHADQVVEDVTRTTKEGRERGCKDWAPCWALPKDQESVRQILNNWGLLELANEWQRA